MRASVIEPTDKNHIVGRLHLMRPDAGSDRDDVGEARAAPVVRDTSLRAGVTNPYQADVPESDLGWQSVLCGRAIRTAFLTGTPQ